MSVQVSSWAWDQQVSSPTTKLVLMALANHADVEGLCFPGTGRLATYAGVSTRTVRRCLEELCELGMLQKVERLRRGDGTLSVWQYRVMWPGVRQGTSVAGGDETPGDDQGTSVSGGDGEASRTAPNAVGNPVDISTFGESPADTGDRTSGHSYVRAEPSSNHSSTSSRLVNVGADTAAVDDEQSQHDESPGTPPDRLKPGDGKNPRDIMNAARAQARQDDEP